MNPELTQSLNSADGAINALLTDPSKNQDQINQLKDLRHQMDSKLQTYKDTTTRAYEQVVKDLNDLLRRIQDLVNQINQPQQ